MVVWLVIFSVVLDVVASRHVHNRRQLERSSTMRSSTLFCAFSARYYNRKVRRGLGFVANGAYMYPSSRSSVLYVMLGVLVCWRMDVSPRLIQIRSFRSKNANVKFSRTQ